MFGSGNNHFRISISNLKQRRVFSLKCFLPGNVVADLNINLLAASLSDKVDLLLIELADIDIVSTKYCDAIFASGAETEEFFYRLGLKDGLNLKNTVKLVLEMIS